MADIPLEVIVPDAWTTKVLDAFNTIADKQMTLFAKVNGAGFGHWNFVISVKDVGETNKQFGERVLRELGIAVINLVDKTEDNDRYDAEVAAISPAISDVPDDVLI